MSSMKFSASSKVSNVLNCEITRFKSSLLPPNNCFSKAILSFNPNEIVLEKVSLIGFDFFASETTSDASISSTSSTSSGADISKAGEKTISSSSETSASSASISAKGSSSSSSEIVVVCTRSKIGSELDPNMSSKEICLASDFDFLDGTFSSLNNSKWGSKSGLSSVAVIGSSASSVIISSLSATSSSKIRFGSSSISLEITSFSVSAVANKTSSSAIISSLSNAEATSSSIFERPIVGFTSEKLSSTNFKTDNFSYNFCVSKCN